MDLLVQFQCLFYSFAYGFVMSGVYHLLNRIVYRISRFFRYIVQIAIGFSFGILYFYGLVVLNDGILRLYFFGFVFLGYLFYQKYYAYYFLCYIESNVLIFKRIFSPFIFFFHFINAIIKKGVKKVRLRWRKEDNSDIKNL